MAKQFDDDTMKWGRRTAVERYGKAHEPALSQKSECEPEAPCDKQAAGYDNKTPDNWLIGGGKGGAEGKPSFDKAKARS